ncbi:MAG: secretin N-terminal domain-containing protein [Rhodospirillaceae bacterium]
MRVAAGAVLRVMLLIGLMALPTASGAAEIPWDKAKTFEKTVQDEDITVILRWILAQNNLQVTFRPGVKGSVTFQFKDMPLQGAFNKLVADYGLDYEYNADIHTVTISPKGQIKAQFISLKYIDKAQIEEARKAFGLNGEMVFHGHTVQLRGDPDQVGKLSDMIDLLEKAEGERRAVDEKRLSAEANATNTMAEAQRKAAEAEKIAAEGRLQEERFQAMRKQRLEIEQISVKVIPLHYASVGPVKLKFQGEDITVPGLIDSLNNLLGVNSLGASGSSSSASSSGNATPSGFSQNGTLAMQSPNTFSSSQQAGGQQERNNLIVVRDEPNAFKGTVSADTRTNSVIVRGTPKEVQQVEQLVAKLDKETAQIEIEIMIVLTEKKAAEELGITWGGEGVNSLSRGRELGAALGGPVNAVATTGTAPSFGALVDGTTATASSATGAAALSLVSPLTLLPTAATGGGTVASFLYRGGRTALAAQINALSRDNRAETLTAPRIVTLDNLTAKITQDKSIFLRSQANTPGAVSTLTQVPAGLTMKITPSVLRRDDVGEDNLVRLMLEAENTTATDTTPSASAGKTGNQIQTQVVIPDGSTFVLGGMVDNQRAENLQGIPLLQEIPLFGELFKDRKSKNDLSQTLFFITPRIVPRADLYVKDVAQKRYLQTLRNDMEHVSSDIEEKSMLLNLDTKNLEEDE